MLSTGTVPSRESGEEGYNYDPLNLGQVVVVPSFFGTQPGEGFLAVFFHVYNGSDQQNLPYQYRLNLYHGETLAISSDPLPAMSGDRHPQNGYLLSLTRLEVQTRAGSHPNYSQSPHIDLAQLNA